MRETNHTVKMRKSSGSHQVRFFKETKKVLEELFTHAIEKDAHKEKYARLITEALAYVYVHRKTDKATPSISRREAQEARLFNDLFHDLYNHKVYDTITTENKESIKDILALTTYSELCDEKYDIPPLFSYVANDGNSIVHNQQRSLEKVYQTILWLKKQRKLFSFIKKNI